MDDSLMLKFITGLLALIISLLGVLMGLLKSAFKSHVDEDRAYREKHDLLVLNISDNYVKKNDLASVRQENADSLNRLHLRIDSVAINFDLKIDKIDVKLDKILDSARGIRV